MKSKLASTETLIATARAGGMFILVDDEGRENEGDVVIPACFATPAAVNFMATHARGLVCLALEEGQVKRLGLPMMTSQNESQHGTAFTVSIEAREGVTTGISAFDRACTISVAIDPNATPQSVVVPGHVFPLVAQADGVLDRQGHTEGAVDIVRMAGLNPSAVICEVMNDDGTMARLPDLMAFAEKHNMPIGTIADLLSYRLRRQAA